MSGGVVIGTRGSDLALWQAARVEAALAAACGGLVCARMVIRTTGDGGTKPLDPSGFKGMFTREIDAALLDGRIALAVHSLKDIPGRLAPGVRIGGVLERGPEEDVLVVKRRPVARIGSSSVRRRCQLAELMPAAETVELRGNVPTRLDKLAADDALDAIVLARAGIERLGLRPEERGFAVETLPILPAAGQGIVAVAVREGDAEAARLAGSITHAPTMLRARAERELLRLLDGTCQLPVGVRTRLRDETLAMEAAVWTPEDGGRFAAKRAAGEGPADAPEALAAEIYRKLA